MFKNWGTWLGIEHEKGQVKEGEQNHDMNKPTDGAQSKQSSSAAEEDAQPPQLVQKARGLSGKSDYNEYSVEVVNLF